MDNARVTDWSELPVLMTISDIERVTGLSKPKAYALAHSPGFPILKLGRRLRVTKESFRSWLDAQLEVHHARES
jgi:excisionase family DNA binding protein